MEYETLDDIFFIVPAIGVQAGECEDPDCDGNHYRLVLCWLFFQVSINLS